VPGSLGVVWLERSENFRAFEMGILMVSIFLFLFFEVGVPVTSVELSEYLLGLGGRGNRT
jgi:hypothetical protein